MKCPRAVVEEIDAGIVDERAAVDDGVPPRERSAARAAERSTHEALEFREVRRPPPLGAAELLERDRRHRRIGRGAQGPRLQRRAGEAGNDPLEHRPRTRLAGLELAVDGDEFRAGGVGIGAARELAQPPVVAQDRIAHLGARGRQRGGDGREQERHRARSILEQHALAAGLRRRIGGDHPLPARCRVGKQHAIAAAVVGVDPLQHIAHQQLLGLEAAADVALVVRHPCPQRRERGVVETLAVVLDGRHDGVGDERPLRALDEQADQEVALARMPRRCERRLDVDHEVGGAAFGCGDRRIENEEPRAAARGRELGQQDPQHAAVDQRMARRARERFVAPARVEEAHERRLGGGGQGERHAEHGTLAQPAQDRELRCEFREDRLRLHPRRAVVAHAGDQRLERDLALTEVGPRCAVRARERLAVEVDRAALGTRLGPRGLDGGAAVERDHRLAELQRHRPREIARDQHRSSAQAPHARTSDDAVGHMALGDGGTADVARAAPHIAEVAHELVGAAPGGEALAEVRCEFRRHIDLLGGPQPRGPRDLLDAAGDHLG